MSAWDSMLSYLRDMAVDTGHHMIHLAMVVVGSNHPSWLMSTLLHFSEKDVGTLDMTSLMFPVMLMRLRDDDDEQHSLHCLASELPSRPTSCCPFPWHHLFASYLQLPHFSWTFFVTLI